MYIRLLYIAILTFGCLFMSYKCTFCKATFKSEFQRSKHEVNTCEATNSSFQEAVASRKRKQEITLQEREQCQDQTSTQLSGTSKRRKGEGTKEGGSDIEQISVPVRLGFSLDLDFSTASFSLLTTL